MKKLGVENDDDINKALGRGKALSISVPAAPSSYSLSCSVVDMLAYAALGTI